MGLLFVLITYAIVFGALGRISSVFLGFLTRRLTKGDSARDKRAIAFAIAVPWIGIGALTASFILYAFTNDSIFHRDAGLGDSRYVRLPNGYTLTTVDDFAVGSVQNAQGQDAASDIRRLEVDGALISGTSDTRRSDDASKVEDGFFILDTSTGSRREFQSLEALEENLRERGIQPHLQPFFDVLSEHHKGWLDRAFLAFWLFLPLGGLGTLTWLIVTARKEGATLPLNTTA